MPFRITAKTVLQFTLRRRTVDSAKKNQRQVFERHVCLCTGRWQQTYQLVYSTDDSTEGKWKCFLFWLCYKRNAKRCSCATIESWMHLGGLLSTTHFDSEDDYRAQVGETSGLRSPGRSCFTYLWNDYWVQTFHWFLKQALYYRKSPWFKVTAKN